VYWGASVAGHLHPVGKVPPLIRAGDDSLRAPRHALLSARSRRARVLSPPDARPPNAAGGLEVLQPRRAFSTRLFPKRPFKAHIYSDAEPLRRQHRQSADLVSRLLGTTCRATRRLCSWPRLAGSRFCSRRSARAGEGRIRWSGQPGPQHRPGAAGWSEKGPYAGPRQMRGRRTPLLASSHLARPGRRVQPRQGDRREHEVTRL
jgi:hypothetical protein